MTNRCPKCGHENPEETLFCEECDWRLDIPYRPEKKRNPLHFAAATLVLGLVAAVCGFTEQYIVSVICGAIAMLIGGYSINLPRLLGSENAQTCMALAAVGLILGVVGFILGFAGYVGGL
ncbi:MAG: hypothetical protein Q4Q58_06465 [Thermoplasmata archaeon]|nr:hypothetical protein [Thermoplasmata archaeon]